MRDFLTEDLRFLNLRDLSHQQRRVFPTYYLAFCLLATDLVFVGIHCLWLAVPAISNYSLSIEADRGYAEIFQYVKLFWIFLNFVSISVIQTRFSYLAWASLFLYLLLDDSLLLHERLGEQIANVFSFREVIYLQLEDLGELLVSFSVFLVFLMLFVAVYPRSSTRFRKDSRALIVMLFGLAVFGVGFDMVHVMLDSMPGAIGRKLYYLAAIIEDGGEMAVVSLICYFSFSKLVIFNRRLESLPPQPKAVNAKTRS
jgi:hypothetical protein